MLSGSGAQPQRDGRSSKKEDGLALVGGIQRELGRLTQAVETLTTESGDICKRVDRLSHVVYTATLIVTILGVVIALAANKLADALLRMASVV